MKKSFLCLSILFILTGFAIAQTRLKEDITCKQALELIQKHSQDTNFVILDVRTPEEFNSGHIKKAIIIDYKSVNFQEEINKLDKRKTYLVYCKAGGRSAKSIEIMKNLNFNNLYHLYEGMEIWKKDGYKVVTD
jgi:rhodanese-related sulfurtransferase